MHRQLWPAIRLQMVRLLVTAVWTLETRVGLWSLMLRVAGVVPSSVEAAAGAVPDHDVTNEAPSKKRKVGDDDGVTADAEPEPVPPATGQ